MTWLMGSISYWVSKFFWEDFLKFCKGRPDEIYDIVTDTLDNIFSQGKCYEQQIDELENARNDEAHTNEMNWLHEELNKMRNIERKE